MELEGSTTAKTRVPRGSYTDYVNSGHSALIDDINSLFEDTPVIGTDVRIEINSDVLKHYGLSDTGKFVFDRESNPHFLKGFVAPLQTFTFSSDKGRPGTYKAEGVSYSKGYLDLYLTKTYYEQNKTAFNTFCKSLNILCQSQYHNLFDNEKNTPYWYSLSHRHSGNLLSINVPLCTLSVFFGEALFARYHNVKFDEYIFQSGDFITNEVLRMRFNFSFSYISFDLSPISGGF